MKRKFYAWLWHRMPEAERQAVVGSWISARARRRAAMSPFRRTFEDEVNNAGVDLYRDINRETY